TPGRPDYSFADLISVFAVAELRRRRVPLQRIRQAKAALAEIVGHEQGLAVAGLFTDGEFVFVDLGVEGQLTNLNRGGQEGVRNMLDLRLERVDYGSGPEIKDRSAGAWFPLDGVRVDPRIQFGAPCLEGRRVTT